MKVLYLVHHSFLEGQNSGSWLNKLQEQVRALGIDACFFDIETHKIADFPIVHLFGFGHFELLFLLKKQGTKIICTPSIGQAQNRDTLSKIIELSLIYFHSIKQRKIPAIDIFHMMRSSDRYIVNQSTSNSWLKSWNLKNISELDFGSKDLAKNISDFYKHLSKNKRPL